MPKLQSTRAALLALAVSALAAPAFPQSPMTSLPRPSAAETAKRVSALAPGAIAWAEGYAQQALARGARLDAAQQQLAARVGVREPGRIRLVVVEGIPLPEEPALKAAALEVGLSQSSAAGLTLGYAVIVRRGWESDPRLLSHEFRHVAQYEEAGGIRAFLARHLANLVEFGYHDSPYEMDARAHEVEAPAGRKNPAA